MTHQEKTARIQQIIARLKLPKELEGPEVRAELRTELADLLGPLFGGVLNNALSLKEQQNKGVQ